ncbi:putative DUF6594 domain-containing protein [Seiridium cardinale]|uniref:DUF6594 domain-containing protein n=1 Tax=Seiridium cardinale TaxID=138064 RepID=A0ABR2Y8R3_9PEZI
MSLSSSACPNSRPSGTELPKRSAKLTEADILLKPWKYVGYKAYAEFISSDDDFFLVRKFGALNARIALVLQDNIVQLEERLHNLDQKNSRKESDDVNNGTIRNDIQSRAELMEDIEKALGRYNNFLIQLSKVKTFAKAPRRNVTSVRNWHYNHDYKAINADEQKYLDKEDDLVSISTKYKTPLRRLMDSSFRLRTLSLWKQKKDVPFYDAEYVAYYSDKRMDRFASGLIVLLGITMLITPLWILQWLHSLTMRLVVITVFNSVFLLVLSVVLVARPFEALGATAAYATVLMVFMQVGTQ